MPRSSWIAIAILRGAGCGRPAEADDRDRVLHALDALRDAPGDALPERTRLLDALAATNAISPRAARARDTCVAAYRLLLSGTSLGRGVQADLTSDAGPAAATIPRLLEAERKINQSRTLMPDCE